MRAFTDYEQTKEYTDFQKLPAGAYEVKIIRAEDSDNALCLLFDITGGEFDNYYHKKFAEEKKNAASQHAKYKGILRLWYPNGGEYDESAKRRMKTALKTIKEDNHLSVDFSREWDGAALKDSRIGMIFREQEWEYNGKTGMTAQPYAVISLEKLRSGNFTLPAPKYLSGANATAPTAGAVGFATVPLDDDLPF